MPSPQDSSIGAEYGSKPSRCPSTCSACFGNPLDAAGMSRWASLPWSQAGLVGRQSGCPHPWPALCGIGCCIGKDWCITRHVGFQTFSVCGLKSSRVLSPTLHPFTALYESREGKGRDDWKRLCLSFCTSVKKGWGGEQWEDRGSHTPRGHQTPVWEPLA